VIDERRVLVFLRAGDLLGEAGPVDEERLVAIGLVLDVVDDLFDRLLLERLLALLAENAGNAFNRLSAFALLAGLAGESGTPIRQNQRFSSGEWHG